MTQSGSNDGDEAEREVDGDNDEAGARKRDVGAPKERVLHTRVPLVLEAELKRLAETLRVPVSNVVRAILEDAVDAVDTVGERTEHELIGFVDRLARHRDDLKSRIARAERRSAGRKARGATPDDATDDVDAVDAGARDASRAPSEGECPSELPALLAGVIGYQPLVLATTAKCGVCDRELRAGSDAHRALFDDPTKRVFLGSSCRLLPEKE